MSTDLPGRDYPQPEIPRRTGRDQLRKEAAEAKRRHLEERTQGEQT